MCRTSLNWAKAVADVLISAGQGPRNRRRGRPILGLEQLGERIVPAHLASTTIWNDTDRNHLWSDADNWSAGLPTASNVAVFNQTYSIFSSDDATFDNTVATANQTVAGIQTVNDYLGTLSLVGGFPLTVSSTSDTNTGFQWTTAASISQSTASDVLIITGGGTAANNVWGNGTIGLTTTQSNVYLNGGTTLRITSNASTLGDNLIVGEDLDGGSTVEFYNQAKTLTLNNNAGILVSDNTSDVTAANQLQFDTDVTQVGTDPMGLDAASSNSFIDNFGVITRSNNGTYQTGVPIKNDVGTYYSGVLDVKTSLWVSGQSASKTAGYAVDQVGGQTILENGATLQTPTTNGYFMSGGQLLTYGSGNDTITRAVKITGGTIEVSADTPSSQRFCSRITSWYSVSRSTGTRPASSISGESRRRSTPAASRCRRRGRSSRGPPCRRCRRRRSSAPPAPS